MMIIGRIDGQIAASMKMVQNEDIYPIKYAKLAINSGIRYLKLVVVLAEFIFTIRKVVLILKAYSIVKMQLITF